MAKGMRMKTKYTIRLHKPAGVYAEAVADDRAGAARIVADWNNRLMSCTDYVVVETPT